MDYKNNLQRPGLGGQDSKLLLFGKNDRQMKSFCGVATLGHHTFLHLYIQHDICAWSPNNVFGVLLRNSCYAMVGIRTPQVHAVFGNNRNKIAKAGCGSLGKSRQVGVHGKSRALLQGLG